MWISNIKIKNFRNYNEAEINLDKNINLFFGENAQGKTNIIESIFMGSMGKSFRAKKDSELIKFDEKKAEIELNYNKIDRDGTIKIEISDKKTIYSNGVRLKKLSELLGKINVVIFTPDDINIIKGSPQNRRKFLDIMISQLKPNYMHLLNLYSKSLEQRNNYLRQIKKENKDKQLLDIWDEEIAQYAIKIFEYRNEFINKIKAKINKIHSEITENKEDLEIEYITECSNKETFLKVLKDRRELDIIKGFTTKGIHRDDFLLYINGKNVSIYGSQGQNRTAVLSLKLSELQIIYDEIDDFPILLLDDFMSELDEKRRESLLLRIKEAQVIITCTEKIDIEKIHCKVYNVVQGKLL